MAGDDTDAGPDKPRRIPAPMKRQGVPPPAPRRWVPEPVKGQAATGSSSQSDDETIFLKPANDDASEIKAATELQKSSSKDALAELAAAWGGAAVDDRQQQ